MSESTGFFVVDNKTPLKESYVAILSQSDLTYTAQNLTED